MNNSELEPILKRARLPKTPDESLEMLPHRVVSRLKHYELPARGERNFPLRLAWGFGLVACVVIAFAIGHWSGRTEAMQSNDVLANATVIREALAMFPNQVRAITEDERGLKLVLSPEHDVPASPPIYIRVCDGKHCVSLVTFSGQEVEIAGQKLTVLSELNGGIILTGNRFVWSSTTRTYAANHLKIEARNLGATAM